MSTPWTSIEARLQWLRLHLLQEPLSATPVALPDEVERSVDEWIRSYLKSPTPLTFPSDYAARGLLFGRLSRAAGFAFQSAAAALPPLEAPEEEVLDLLLIEMWYSRFRGRWLQGRRGLNLEAN